MQGTASQNAFENATAAHEPRPSKAQTRTGWGISGAVIAFLLFDAAGKLLKPAAVVQAFRETGWPIELSVPIGVILLTCTVAYLIPRTCVLGAILLTGYLGGGVATTLRLENPLACGVAERAETETPCALEEVKPGPRRASYFRADCVSRKLRAWASSGREEFAPLLVDFIRAE